MLFILFFLFSLCLIFLFSLISISLFFSSSSSFKSSLVFCISFLIFCSPISFKNFIILFVISLWLIFVSLINLLFKFSWFNLSTLKLSFFSILFNILLASIVVVVDAQAEELKSFIEHFQRNEAIKHYFIRKHGVKYDKNKMFQLIK